MTKPGAVQEISGWAIEAGRRVAARRQERDAEREAEAAAEAGRRQLPDDLLARRFAEVAAAVVGALDQFGQAAGIQIDSATPAAGLLQLRAGDDALRLVRDDAVLVATLRCPSRAEQVLVDLSAEEFSPVEPARRISEAWIAYLSASEGARHA